MATLCYFPSCSSISSRKIFCTHHHHLICKPIFNHVIIQASATKNSRRNAKIKSNDELYNDIRGFVATLGLPENHVPSTKELLQHGRKDLANIVRRRGHKLIWELLANSLNEVDDCEDLTGQNLEMDGTDDDVVISSGKVAGDLTLSSDVPEKENQSSTSYSDSDLKTEDTKFKPLESAGLSLKKEDLSKLDGQDESNNIIAENTSSNSEACVIINIDSSANLSLEEKVTKFAQSGDLEPVEALLSGIPNGNISEKSKVYTESEHVVEMPLRTHSAGHSTQSLKGDAALELNGNLLTSEQAVSSATMYHHLRGDHMPAEDVASHFDTDLDEKATERPNQSEIDHLKFTLHQKELEMTMLKEHIEKEKLALSLLQTKAETELSKAGKRISETVAELHAAEESLPGLKEVEIQFCGNADDVEVTGSFNGWHHRMKMDPKLSTSVTDSAGSRRSILWSTVLWLYPGSYEIKFIVDGHWKIDPERETVRRGHIFNNIIRVNK